MILLWPTSLDDRGHKVTITADGEECLKAYHDELHRVTLHSDPTEHILPFDVVILDYMMPKMDGLEAAKEILAVNPHQRIVLLLRTLETHYWNL